MTVNLVPYGLLPNGNYGINLDNSSGDPRAAALEILDTLPSVASSDNFEGRLVYSIDDITMYVYTIEGTFSQWVALEGVPATVGETYLDTNKPEVTGSETSGELFWTTDTEVLFVWDGVEWQAAGGRYATTVTEELYQGDGGTISYSLGVSSALPSELVEVFIDGVRQISLEVADETDTPDIDGDFSIVGTNIVFTVPPVGGAQILTRAYDTVEISQTAKVIQTIKTAAAGEDTFDTGTAGAQPASIIVVVDGITKTLGASYDYQIEQQDDTVLSITRVGTIATVITQADHGLSDVAGDVGTVIEQGGAAEDEYNDSFVITTIPNSTEYTFDVPDTYAASATAAPILYFSPRFIEDKVVFITPLSAGEVVDIRTLKNIVTSPTEGEANTLSIVPGTSSNRQNIVSGKVDVDLRVKGLVAGANVSISNNGDSTDLVITASTGANFEKLSEESGSIITPDIDVSYVGVLDTNNGDTTSIIVDLSTSGVGGGAPAAGRKITIKDEGGSSSIRNIEISGPSGATFDETSSPYVMSADRGSVTLVLDGSNNWNITSSYAGVRTYSGVGSPDGVVFAVKGSMYTNTSGGAGTTLYVKESGSDEFGWVAK